MSKVIPITKAKKHIYELKECAGCSVKIDNCYTEVKLPYDDFTKHIALCEKCAEVSRQQGIF